MAMLSVFFPSEFLNLILTECPINVIPLETDKMSYLSYIFNNQQ